MLGFMKRISKYSPRVHAYSFISRLIYGRCDRRCESPPRCESLATSGGPCSSPETHSTKEWNWFGANEPTSSPARPAMAPFVRSQIVCQLIYAHHTARLSLSWTAPQAADARKPHCPFPVIQQLRCPSPAAHKVQNERNYSENEQNVNKPARYVKNTEAQ